MPSLAADCLLDDNTLHDAGKLASKRDRLVISPPAAVGWGPVRLMADDSAPAIPAWVAEDPALRGAKGRSGKVALSKPTHSG